MKLGMGKLDLLAISILTGTFCFAIWVGAGGLSLLTIALVAAITISCLFFGRASLRALSLPLPSSALFPAEMLAGIAIMSVTMLMICLAARASAGAAFLLICIAGLGLFGFDVVRDRCWVLNISKSSASNRLTPVIVSFICGVSLVWSWQAIRSFARLRAEGILHAWVDFFFHSTVIAQFGHFSALNGTSMFSYETRVPLYHWASYMLPAVLSTFSNTPALVVATTFWVLLGFVMMALGAWALGAVLADWIGGIAAVVLILLAPSAAHYGLRNRFFDFPWLLQISAGLSFGVGLCLLTIALFIVAIRHRNVLAAGVAMALALAEAAFKIHFLVTLFPACGMLFILLWQWTQPKMKFVALGALTSAALVLMFLAEGVSRAPHFFTGAHDVTKILTTMLDMQPSAAPHLFPAITTSTPAVISVPAGILLVLVAATGVLLPFYFLAWAYCHRRGLAHPTDCFPLLLIAAYCIVICSFPTDTFTGDPTEYQHRNFVLIYAVLAVWCSYFAVASANYLWGRRSLLILTACACCLLPVPLLLESTTETNTLAWTRSLATNPVPLGLLESAEYLRKVASRRDVLLASDFKDEPPLVALSERRALLVMDESYARGLSYSSEAIAKRIAVGQQLKRATSYEEMQQIARANAIDWYVASPGSILAASLRKNAAVCTHGYCVIHLKKHFGAER
ncbi:MAG TPA: hypothetical protein VLJ11_03630 [Bryobacteraceae bacterium]|nr:hypothetical protein [Bryobacteraceae bacterium]